MAGKRKQPDETIDLRKTAQQAAKEVEEAKAPADEPHIHDKRVKLIEREISFEISYDGPDGKDYTDTLTSKIMDADARLAKARVVGQLTRGLSYDALSQEDRFRVEALSRASIMLVEPPQWVYDFMGEDIELLLTINNILMEHEARYFRGNARQGEGEEVKPRVRSTVAAFAEESPAGSI